jgi:hypothetical protein
VTIRVWHLFLVLLVVFAVIGVATYASAVASHKPITDPGGLWLTEKQAALRFKASPWGQALLSGEEDLVCKGNAPERDGRFKNFYCFDNSSVIAPRPDRIRTTADGGLLLMDAKTGKWSRGPRQTPPRPPRHHPGKHVVGALPAGVHWLRRGRLAATTCKRISDIELSPNNALQGSDFQLLVKAGISGEKLAAAYSWCADPSLQHDGIYGRPDSTVVRLTATR